jgi:transcriptional regulator with XRE-family HTH domain
MAKVANPRSVGKADKDMGQRIRLRRVELKRTQRELAEVLGVTFQQLQKYEKGLNRVGAARLERIAAFLDVPITFFYDGVKRAKGRRKPKACCSLMLRPALGFYAHTWQSKTRR